MVFPIKKKKSAFETAVEANKPKPAPEATVTPTGNKIRGQEELIVESGGKKYPTTNPDFRPDANAEQITFKQGGGVEIIPVGSTTPIQLTKEEYNTSQGGAGNVTNKVKELQNPPQQIPNVTGQPNLTPEDISGAVPQSPLLENTVTGASAIGGAISGAGAGAGIGSIVPGVGTLVGGVVGGVAGLIGGAYTKITIAKRGDVKQAKKVATTANTNFGQTIDALNAGQIDHATALKRWNEDKVALYAARANLKRDTATSLKRFLSGGADELVQVNDYIRDLETIYNNEFLQAYVQPDKNKIKYLNQTPETEE